MLKTNSANKYMCFIVYAKSNGISKSKISHAHQHIEIGAVTYEARMRRRSVNGTVQGKCKMMETLPIIIKETAAQASTSALPPWQWRCGHIYICVMTVAVAA